MNLSIQVLIAFQCSCDEIPDAGQEINAHARMEAVGVVAANGKKADFGLVTERHECGRANFLGVVLEQEHPLRIANLPAARSLAIEEGVKWPKRFVLALHGVEEATPLNVFEHRRISKQDQDRMIGTETTAHGLFDGRDTGLQVGSGEQLQS